MKKFLKNQNGITMMGLIITVIVLLIIAVVIMRTAFGESNSIFRTKSAVNDSNKAEFIQSIKMDIYNVNRGSDLIDKVSLVNILDRYGSILYENGDSSKAIIGITTRTSNMYIPLEEIYSGNYTDELGMNKLLYTKVEVGDYVTYQPNVAGQSPRGYTTRQGENGSEDQIITATLTDNTWRVLYKENGCVTLVYDRTIGDNNGQQLKFSGAIGYTNIAEELDNICEVYGRGKYATGARSITLEDIEKIAQIDNNEGFTITKSNVKNVMITSGKELVAGSDTPQIIQNKIYSFIRYGLAPSYDITKISTELVFGPGDYPIGAYFLATPTFEAVADRTTNYGVLIVSGAPELGTANLVSYMDTTTGINSEQHAGVRPVVTLSPHTELTMGEDGNVGDGTRGNPYRII